MQSVEGPSTMTLPSAPKVLRVLPLLLTAALHATAGSAQTVDQAEGQLRLVSRVDINGYATGALHVFSGDAYGAVCSQSFDNKDADVACRQLGFVGGSVLRSLAGEQGSSGSDFLSEEFRSSILKEVTAQFVLGNLACTGGEDRLVDCAASQDVSEDDSSPADYYYSYNDYDTGSCEVVFVACGMSADAGEGDVRLVGGDQDSTGNSASGLLEVFSSGAWGRVCRLSPGSFQAQTTPAPFTDAAAAVACRQLGFSSGTVAVDQGLEDYINTYIDDDTWRIPIVLAGVRCDGSEASLLDCPGGTLEDDNIPCELPDEVGLICVNDPDAGTNGELRLADGQAGADFEYGRLQVFANGTWGSVCDRPLFTTNSAQVACKSLGYDGGAPLRFLQPYEREGTEDDVLTGDLPVIISEVRCAGDEASLLECPARTTGIRRCGFVTPGRTDATVVACGNSVGSSGCPTGAPEEGSLRLRGGVGTPCDSLHSGFVEIFHRGEWGRAETGTHTLAADVACRQLGFPHGTPVRGGSFRSSVTPFSQTDPERPGGIRWLNTVRCRGPEERLVDCDLRRGFDRVETTNLQPDFVVCRQFAVEEAQESVTTPGAGQGDLRLANEIASAPWVSGRLEIFFEGSWSQVCGLGFDGFDADVACRQLGYGQGTANAVRRTAVGESEFLEFRRVNGSFAEVAVTKVGCTGAEESILECGGDSIIDGLRTRECDEERDPGLFLSCVEEPVAGQEGDLRLVDGISGDGFATGVLEIFHAGAWGTVCDGRRMPEARPFERDDIVMEDYYIGLSPASSEVVCQQLGLDVGVFRQINNRDRTSPPWVGQLECTGFEDVFTECDDVLFGDTQECDDSQLRLLCSSFNAEDRLGEALLRGGRSDASGGQAWSYGSMDVHDGFVFAESCLIGPASAVACRSLGFSTGAQLFVPGDQEALPLQSEDSRITSIDCAGAEASLTACTIQRSRPVEDPFEVLSRQVPQSCAVACSNPAGCTSDGGPPAQGDLRLVPVVSGAAATSSCDELHFGAVEIFNRGQWGRICTGNSANGLFAFQLVASVACRQLGFPFASLLPMTTDNVATGAASIAWATDVRCTGLEERLDECIFPEAPDVPASDTGAVVDDLGGYGGSVTPGNLPVEPISEQTCTTTQAERFAVVCRMFEIEESDVIR